MNAAEFQVWFKFHCTHFPAVEAMIRQIAESPEKVDRHAVKAAWMNTLKACPLDDAKAATKHLHSGVDGDPGWPDKHPAAVLEFCRGLSASRRAATNVYHDGEKAVFCRDCGDVGMVICFAPETIRHVFRTGAIGPRKTCAYPCHCAAGDARAKTLPRLPRYDAKRTCIANGLNDEARLVEWVANYERPTPENHEHAFDEFSGKAETQSTMEW